MINAAAALVTAVTAMVSGIMIGRSRSRSEREEQAKAIAAIKVAAEQAAEQTTNSHGTNLRDDLTAVQDRVDLILDALAAESRVRRETDAEFGRKLDAVALSARIDHSEIFQRVAALEHTTSDCSLSRLPRDPEGVV